MAVVLDTKWAGNKVSYHSVKQDSALANNASLAVDHAADPNQVRQVRIINMATGVQVITGFTVTYTDDDTTTVTNTSGGTVNWKVVVTVEP